MSAAHPPTRTETLSSGQKITLRPWTMAQRAELRPRVRAVLAKLMALDKLPAADLVEVFLVCEDEVVEIVYHSVVRQPATFGGHLLTEEQWQEIAWTHDIPVLALGLWKLNLASWDGLVGKAMAGLGKTLADGLVAGVLDRARERAEAQAAAETETSTPTAPSSSSWKGEASPSSPEGATATLS